MSIYNSVSDALIENTITATINSFNYYNIPRVSAKSFIELRIVNLDGTLDSVEYRNLNFRSIIDYTYKKYNNILPEDALLDLVKSIINNLTRDKNGSVKIQKAILENKYIYIYIGSISIPPDSVYVSSLEGVHRPWLHIFIIKN